MKSDGRFNTLIVDDNRGLREILEEYLRGEGYFVSGADNGREALEKHHQEHFDLIITDLNMPELSGMELIRTIKKESDATEFIIITGYASMDSAVEAVRTGAFDYIVKPFRMEELQVVVKNVREKVMLKKLNAKLLNTLQSFYDEMERYRQGKPETEQNAEETAGGGILIDTERIIYAIRNLEKMKRGRLLIE